MSDRDMNKHTHTEPRTICRYPPPPSPELPLQPTRGGRYCLRMPAPPLLLALSLLLTLLIRRMLTQRVCPLPRKRIVG